MFKNDEEFCAKCGTILPTPDTVPSDIKCALCGEIWHIKGRMNFLVGRYERNYLKKLKELEEDKTEGDVIVEHICPRCNYNLATYDTAQTRSADEGQTVFYSCVKCKHRSIEYS